MSGLCLQFGDYSCWQPDEFEELPRPEFLGTCRATDALAAAATGATIPAQLQQAPLASWFLARLKHLSQRSDFPEKLLRKEKDLGGYLLELLVTQGPEVVGQLTIEADSGETALFVEAASQVQADLLSQQFIAGLVAEPLAVARCAIRVRAVSLKASNDYGWDGKVFLGAKNVVE